LLPDDFSAWTALRRRPTDRELLGALDLIFFKMKLYTV